MREKLIVANWKMYKTPAETKEFMQHFPAELKEISGIEIVICPPFTSLAVLAALLENTPLSLGAQNMYWEKEGAYTGEISPPMLNEIGAKYVIVGHSERRKYFAENDLLIHKKTAAALNYGLIPILCLGENLEERGAKKTEKVLKEQLFGALSTINPGDKLQKIVLAYEPVWAIGTGTPAGEDEAAGVAAYLRSLLHKKWGAAVAEKARILYGGSVNKENITAFTGKGDLDGALVGGASLRGDSFAGLIKAVLYRRGD